MEDDTYLFDMSHFTSLLDQVEEETTADPDLVQVGSTIALLVACASCAFTAQ